MTYSFETQPFDKMLLKDVLPHLRLQLLKIIKRSIFSTYRSEEDPSPWSWLDATKRAARADREGEANVIGDLLLGRKENPRTASPPPQDARALNGAEWP